MLAAYGPYARLGPLTYEEWFGLWLNLGRVRKARTWATLKALEMAGSFDPIPAGYFDAVTSCEEESVALEYRTNKARVQAGIFRSL